MFSSVTEDQSYLHDESHVSSHNFNDDLQQDFIFHVIETGMRIMLQILLHVITLLNFSLMKNVYENQISKIVCMENLGVN